MVVPATALMTALGADAELFRGVMPPVPELLSPPPVMGGGVVVLVLRVTFRVTLFATPAVPPPLVLVYGVALIVCEPVGMFQATISPLMSPEIDHGAEFSIR